jgi:hypothetical protein
MPLNSDTDATPIYSPPMVQKANKDCETNVAPIFSTQLCRMDDRHKEQEGGFLHMSNTIRWMKANHQERPLATEWHLWERENRLWSDMTQFLYDQKLGPLMRAHHVRCNQCFVCSYQECTQIECGYTVAI